MTEESNSELAELTNKTEKNELRARDAEARLRIIEAELAIIERRRDLDKVKR